MGGPAAKAAAGAALPPRPAIFSEANWSLSYSVPDLVETLLSAHNPRGGTSCSKLAGKAQAALWLGQRLAECPAAVEEALKCGAVDVVARLLSPQRTTRAVDGVDTANNSSEVTLAAGLLGALAEVAAASPAAREALLAAKPGLIPPVLAALQMGTSAGALVSSLRLLFALATARDSAPRLRRLLVGWDQRPLAAELQPAGRPAALGGRTALIHAAELLEALIRPLPALASSLDEGNASCEPGMPGDDASLTAALQDCALRSGMLTAAAKLAAAASAPMSARAAALAAAAHLLSAAAMKTATSSSAERRAEFVSAGGLRACTALLCCKPESQLRPRAAAVACLHSFLAMHVPATPVGVAASLPPKFGTACFPPPGENSGWTTSVPCSPRPLLAAPDTAAPLSAQDVRANVLAAARAARRQQRQRGAALTLQAPAAGTTVDGLQTVSAASSMRPAVAAPCFESRVTTGFDCPPVSSTSSTPAALHTGCCWHTREQEALAARAREVLAAGALPGLLLLCCAPAPPPPVLAAAMRAAAAGAGCRVDTAGGAAVPAAAAELAAIAEQQRGVCDSSGGRHAAARKLDPAELDAQGDAAAAVQLLAASGDEGRAALAGMGAADVLAPMLSALACRTRWAARHALAALALAPSPSSAARPARSAAQRAAGRLTAAATAAQPAVASIPEFLTGTNLPGSHWRRVAPLPVLQLPVLQAQLPAMSRRRTSAAGGEVISSCSSGAASRADSATKPVLSASQRASMSAEARVAARQPRSSLAGAMVAAGASCA